MFTLEDICNIAVQIERNGEAAYRQAAKKTSDPEIEDLLTRMADDEQRHGRWFDALSARHGKKVSEHQEMEEMGRALLQEMVKDQTFSLDSSDLSGSIQMEAVVEQAKRFENDTISFYEMLSDFVEDAAVQAQLEVIIEEERQHIVQLNHMQGIAPA